MGIAGLRRRSSSPKVVPLAPGVPALNRY
ncbi:unnamed protein product [Gulo gulo]|uniref:Uncharacterized protein n=1 Tax=Gulo gulo TaxID=48420 RepID=A0A9X9PUP5_GULGU|nr:unnamed protein product [Gulo gulo]